MSDTQELVDVIYDMYDLLQKQEREISILRKEMALVSGKVNGVLFPDTKFPAKPEINSSPQIKAIEKDLDKSQKSIGTPLQSQKTVVYGQIYNADQKPVHSANVKITDGNGKVVKTTKTNMAGKWMAHLPPGRYSIRYSHSKMAPSYRMAVVKEGQEELEVL